MFCLVNWSQNSKKVAPEKPRNQIINFNIHSLVLIYRHHGCEGIIYKLRFNVQSMFHRAQLNGWGWVAFKRKILNSISFERYSVPVEKLVPVLSSFNLRQVC